MGKAALTDVRTDTPPPSWDISTESRPVAPEGPEMSEIELGTPEGAKKVRRLNSLLETQQDFCIHSWEPPEATAFEDLSIMKRPLTTRSRIFVFSIPATGCTGLLAVRSLANLPRTKLWVDPPATPGDILVTHWGHVLSEISAPRILDQLLEAVVTHVKDKRGALIAIPKTCHPSNSARVGTEGLLAAARRSRKFKLEETAHIHRLRITS